MDRNSIIRYKGSLDSIAQYIEGEKGEQVEVWFARELMTVLGYARWENFQSAIARAIESCKSQKINADDHFREVTKMIAIGKGGQRGIRPENLPAAEDIKKVERKVASEEKQIAKTATKLPKND